jgi:hypothetical protein
VTFRSRWSCDMQFHKYVVHINRNFCFSFYLITQYPEWSDDKLRPQMLWVGTTANASLRLITDAYHYYIISIVNYDIPQYYIISIVNYDIIQYYMWWMYVIIGRHFVPLKGRFLLLALVIVRITLNVIVRQMPLNFRSTTLCPLFKNLLANSQKLRQRFRNRWK